MLTSQKSGNDFDLDIHTIRQRVAAIKRNWSEDEVQRRAQEGLERRQELAELIRSLEEEAETVLVCY